MAAVTVQDCLKIVPNRFELALIASYRAKQLMNGAPMLYTPKKKEKNTVIALREIAAGLLDIEAIKKEIQTNIKNHMLFKNFDDNIAYDDKKEDDTDLENSLDTNKVLDELDDLSDDDNDITVDDEDDEEYYDSLDNDSLDDDLDNDLDK